MYRTLSGLACSPAALLLFCGVSSQFLPHVQAMAMCGAQVVVSDTQDMMQLLRINIEANMAALQTSSGKLIGSISIRQLRLMLPNMLR